MDSDNNIGLIELGNVKTKCLISSCSNNSESLSTAEIKSEGIHNGVIVNLANASKMIRSCISIAEKKAKISLKKINVIIEQPEFLCTKFSKHKKIDGSKIEAADIKFLLSEGKKQASLNDSKQSIIHIFNYNYLVDGKRFIDEPIDVFADYLSHEMAFITMPKNNIKNINKTFLDCDIEVERLFSCTFALGVKLLNERELQSGSLLIDLGFEKVSIGLFKDLALIHSVTFPVGINHVTKDISKVCSLTIDEAENIKNEIDFSFKNNSKLFDKNGYLKDTYFKNSTFRKISQTMILDVVQARINEIFQMVKRQVFDLGLNLICGENIYIVGGGAQAFNLENYCSDFFKNSVKKKSIDDENFASCLGALKIIKYGWETEAIPESINENTKKVSIFSRFFRGKF